MVYQATPIKRDIEFPRTIADVYKKIKGNDGNFDCLEVEGITYNEKTKQVCVTAFIAGDNRKNPTAINFPYVEVLERLRGKEIYDYDSGVQGVVFIYIDNLSVDRQTGEPQTQLMDFADYFDEGVVGQDVYLETMYEYLKRMFKNL